MREVWLPAGASLQRLGLRLFAGLVVAGSHRRSLHAECFLRGAAALAGHGAPPGRWLVGLVAGAGLGNNVTLVLLAPSLRAALEWRSGLTDALPAAHRSASRSPHGWRVSGRDSGWSDASTSICRWPHRRTAGIGWGEANSVSGFLWMVGGGPYRGYQFGLPLADAAAAPVCVGIAARRSSSAGWVSFCRAWPVEATGQWRPPWTAQRRWLCWWHFVLYSAYAIGYRTADSIVYMIPAYLVAALWLAKGLHGVLAGFMAWSSVPQRSMEISAGCTCPVRMPGGLLAAVAACLGQACGRCFQAIGLPCGTWRQLCSVCPRHSLVIPAATITRLRCGMPLPSLRPDIVVLDRDLAQFDWYRRRLAKALGEPGAGSVAARRGGLRACPRTDRRCRASRCSWPMQTRALQQAQMWTHAGPFLRLSSSAP